VRGHRLVGARLVATVKNDLVTPFNQQLPDHQAEAGR
jgi:hypothetical protein